jgi:hypothetical protein
LTSRRWPISRIMCERSWKEWASMRFDRISRQGRWTLSAALGAHFVWKGVPRRHSALLPTRTSVNPVSGVIGVSDSAPKGPSEWTCHRLWPGFGKKRNSLMKRPLRKSSADWPHTTPTTIPKEATDGPDQGGDFSLPREWGRDLLGLPPEDLLALEGRLTRWRGVAARLAGGPLTGGGGTSRSAPSG